MKDRKSWNNMCGGNGTGSAVYAMGFIGALIYYIQHSATFPETLMGILKALFWPAFLIHQVFTNLGM